MNRTLPAVLAIALAGLAPQAFAQPSAVRGALTTAPQAKVATPAPAPTVKPGAGGGPQTAAAAAAPTLAEAIAARNVGAAVDAGATPADIARIMNAISPDIGAEPDSAAFFQIRRADNGQLEFGVRYRRASGGSGASTFPGYVPPESLALPAPREQPPPPTPAQPAAAGLN